MTREIASRTGLILRPQLTKSMREEHTVNTVVGFLDRATRGGMECVAKGSISVLANERMVDEGAKTRNTLSANLQIYEVQLSTHPAPIRFPFTLSSR